MKIATAQFPVSFDLKANCNHILRQMQQAKAAGATVIHFPEAALSGYAPVDLPNYQEYDWEQRRHYAEAVLAEAGKVGIWVILGSAHPLTAGHKPHNSLYLISDEGKLLDRYDKRFCAGDPNGDKEELAIYTPGNRAVIFDIHNIRCGLLICHEYRYPELYRDLVRRGVKLVFHSFHAGGMTPERQAKMETQVGEAHFDLNHGRTLPEITMPATLISYAANNGLWISASNTSTPESCYGAFVVRPDGVKVGQSPKNQPHVLLTTLDLSGTYYDATAPWRARAMHGQLHSGTLVDDVRSTARTKF